MERGLGFRLVSLLALTAMLGVGDIPIEPIETDEERERRRRREQEDGRKFVVLDEVQTLYPDVPSTVEELDRQFPGEGFSPNELVILPPRHGKTDLLREMLLQNPEMKVVFPSAEIPREAILAMVEREYSELMDRERQRALQHANMGVPSDLMDLMFDREVMGSLVRPKTYQPYLSPVLYEPRMQQGPLRFERPGLRGWDQTNQQLPLKERRKEQARIQKERRRSGNGKPTIKTRGR